MSRVRLGVVSLALLFVAYIAAYAVLFNANQFGLDFETDGRISGVRFPSYRAGGETAVALFQPVEWLDRQLRPSYWRFPIDDHHDGLPIFTVHQ